MSDIARRLEQVRQRIAAAVSGTGRAPAAIELLAVSKTFSADDIRLAYLAGQRAFGENYGQEAVAKIEALSDLREQLSWHFIGPLQSNKTGLVAKYFDWVHSVDRLKIAQRLSAQRPAHLPALQICIQINISGEPTKSGIAPTAAAAFAHAVAALPRLQLRGLMTIPQAAADPAAQRAPYRALRQLQQALNAAGLGLDTLSGGMSNDLEAAILEGATIVRIGAAIFGARQ